MDGTDIRFIQIPECVLKDERLTWLEMMVFGRIYGMAECYESKEHMASYFGDKIKPETLRKAKQKLERLGWIVAVRDEGHGKVYRHNFEKVAEETIKLESRRKSERQKNATHDSFGDSGCQKNDYNLGKKMPPEYKEEYKEENNSSKELLFAESDNETSKKFGNEDINDALEQWKEATGFDYSSNATERRAIYNLLRRKDVQSYGGFKALVSMVKSAGRVDNQFAPKIVKPSELGGKYSKLERLVNWSKQNEQRQSNPAPQRPWQPQPDTRIIGTYYKPHPEVVESRPVFMTQEQIEEERKQRHKEAQKVRAKFEQMMSRIKRNKESE